MLNKTKSFALICFLFPVFVFGAGKAERFDEDSAKLLAKKYVPQRPSETLVWKDDLPNNDRVDLDNKYYSISYPKCFKVEPMIPEDDITIKTSAALNFDRTASCKSADSNSTLIIMFNHNLKKTDIKFFKTLPRPNPNTLYAQNLTINGTSAQIFARLVSSRNPKAMFQPVIMWSVDILCEGKNIETYEMGFVGATGDAVKQFLNQKKFEIPADYKQIISSFHCRKDR